VWILLEITAVIALRDGLGIHAMVIIIMIIIITIIIIIIIIIIIDRFFLQYSQTLKFIIHQSNNVFIFYFIFLRIIMYR